MVGVLETDNRSSLIRTRTRLAHHVFITIPFRLLLGNTTLLLLDSAGYKLHNDRKGYRLGFLTTTSACGGPTSKYTPFEGSNFVHATVCYIDSLSHIYDFSLLLRPLHRSEGVGTTRAFRKLIVGAPHLQRIRTRLAPPHFSPSSPCFLDSNLINLHTTWIPSGRWHSLYSCSNA